MTSIQIARNCFKDEAEALLRIIPLIDNEFEKAVDLIYKCTGKFIVTGVGKSGHVGEKISATLASLGTPSFFINPLDAYHGDLGMIDSNDVVLALSYSGNTDELLRFIPLLVERSIPIIAMTGNVDSLLAKFSTCILNISVEREADPLNLAPTCSTTAQMAMGDALACALVKKRDFKESDFAKFHPGGNLGRRLLTRVTDVMRKTDLPILNSKMTLLEALVIISNGKLGMAVVLENNTVKGLVTDGDIRRTIQNNVSNCFSLCVEQIMNTTPKTINEDEYLVVADNIFKHEKIHTLLVISKKNEFVGFIDSHDCIF